MRVLKSFFQNFKLIHEGPGMFGQVVKKEIFSGPGPIGCLRFVVESWQWYFRVE